MSETLQRRVVGIYIRLGKLELSRLQADPDILPKYDPRPALGDGRAIDIGRAWEELGVFLDGGVRAPDHGPTVGEIPLAALDTRAMWSVVTPERVAHYSTSLTRVTAGDFAVRYAVDNEDTQPSLPGSRTAGFGDRGQYMFKKLKVLAAHYVAAAEAEQGMLVRIGERM